MRSESLKGHLDSLILAVLAGGPRHGYAVIEELECRSGGVLALPEGTVYPALHRLEESGLLASAWSSESGRRRRIYKLTRRGQRELGLRRTEWRQFVSTVDAVMAGT